MIEKLRILERSVIFVANCSREIALRDAFSRPSPACQPGDRISRREQERQGAFIALVRILGRQQVVAYRRPCYSFVVPSQIAERSRGQIIQIALRVHRPKIAQPPPISKLSTICALRAASTACRRLAIISLKAESGLANLTLLLPDNLVDDRVSGYRR